ncbi:hypothetical protein X798_02752 [Onchocerca flexuosa]|uniref:Uncharacterized protein n=1 Tax=Onchocerca flexuosa TaxID=387005 RepID=A0A238BY35_9BILA|nr:hypothetical protein X798_02752 [Onchocerca flexuosa]
MTDMRNMEDDNANDLPMDQSAVAFDDVLDELLEPDRVVHAGHFLGICSTEEARIINNASVVVGNSRELIDNNEEVKILSTDW